MQEQNKDTYDDIKSKLRNKKMKKTNKQENDK